MFTSRPAKRLISVISSLIVTAFGFTASPAQASGGTFYVAQGSGSAGNGTSCASPNYVATLPGVIGETHDVALVNAIAAVASPVAPRLLIRRPVEFAFAEAMIMSILA